MKTSRSSIAFALRCCTAVGVLVASMVALSGCAANKPGNAQSGAQSDLVTASDETDARRRARIRLELAVGYFEQGQTNIALDELKQSIATDPIWSEAYNLRGLVYMRLNEMRLAEESFQRALQINPRDGNFMHNYGWLACQLERYAQASQLFGQALANPAYNERAKTWMAQGLCQLKAGQRAEGETSLLHAYELDAGNPITAYNLSLALFQRGDLKKAQFYIRRLNNTDLANAESLWLGVRVERGLKDTEAMQQLSGQLKKRFPQSKEAKAMERGAFDE